MAKIFKTSGGQKTAGDYTAIQGSIDSYWSDPKQEKTFPITLWKLKQLINAYPSSEVALKVTDISSPALVDAQWVAYDESLESVLAMPTVQPATSYYVLSESNFDDLRKGGSEIKDNEMLIIGRIGKQIVENTTSYYAFICIGSLVIKGPIGSGGQGASTGYKIPSP